MNEEVPTSPVEVAIRDDLLERHGPLLSGPALQRALGYPSLAAMRQSISRETFPVPTFLISGRRGRFALTWVVARWLALRQGSCVAPGVRGATGPPAESTRSAAIKSRRRK